MEAIIESEKLVKNKLKQMNLNLEEKQVELESLQEEFTTAIQIKGWSCKVCPNGANGPIKWSIKILFGCN